MTETDRAEALRQEGLALVRANRLEDALPVFDQALSRCTDERSRELITINKADALIALEQRGPEVQALPRIVMRRDNPRHVALAAFSLLRKFSIEKDYRKAASYGRIALESARQAGEDGWEAAALIGLGNLAVYESDPEEATTYYDRAIPMLGDSTQDRVSRAICTQNLGYCRLMAGDPAGGIDLIHQALSLMEDSGASGYAAESYLDLCLGYLELEQLDLARRFGERGLSEATEVRQVRNAHYLLGEIAYKLGDIELAEHHFDHLASHYPDFPNLKNLLYAIDLRKMVNFKL